MTQQGRSKYLLKNTLVFSIGTFGAKMITFFLVPLYTNVLNTSQYGIVDLVTSMQNIIVPILSLNIGEAVMRFMLNKNADAASITNMGLAMALFGTIFGLAMIPVIALFPSIKDCNIYIYLYIITMIYSNIFLCNLRGREQLAAYSLGNIINMVSVAVLNIVFLIVLNTGIKGYFISYSIAQGITAIYAFVAGKGYKAVVRFRLNKKICLSMVKYSVVLIPTSFMWWIINSSDRVMITSMIGASANGIYSVSYKFPTMVTGVAGIFNQAWTYSAIREEDSEDKDKYTNSIYLRLSSCIIVVSAALMMLIKPLLTIFVEDSYYEAWKYTPYLIIGVAFSTLATFLATSYTVHFNSKGYLFSGSCGALVNIILNAILIPIMGISGAALATCISYISVFVYRAIDTRKYIKINIMPLRNCISYLIMIVMGFTMYIDNIYGQLLLILEFIAVLFINIKYILEMLSGLIKVVLKK